jgi:hypothetical protein
MAIDTGRSDMATAFTDLIPGPIRSRIRKNGLPDVGYAVAGVLDLAHSEILALPGTITSAPVSAWVRASEQATAAATESTRIVTSLRTVADETYLNFVQRGERRVVEVSTERAVRRKVGRVEDNVAPKAARAAVQIQQRRRRWQESNRVQDAMTTARRTHIAAKRSADKFAEMNAPVLAESQ